MFRSAHNHGVQGIVTGQPEVIRRPTATAPAGDVYADEEESLARLSQRVPIVTLAGVRRRRRNAVRDRRRAAAGPGRRVQRPTEKDPDTVIDNTPATSRPGTTEFRQ